MDRTNRCGRDVHGILLLDKPKGISSNDVLQKVKRIYGANRAGHTGTLDPLATGMLPICLGEATKFSQYILDSNKRYRVIARLGERTDTSDADGNVVQTRPIAFNKKELHAALECFRGYIMQVPSMYSALKYQGRKLYEYAREGLTIKRQPRPITIYELTFISLQNDELELEIYCSKGTYIRTIIDDLGEKLGCGAHVVMLHRLQVAHYPFQKMVTLRQLQAIQVESQVMGNSPEIHLDSLLLPMDSSVVAFPEVNLQIGAAVYLRLGQSVNAGQVPAKGLVRVSEGKEHKFIGIAEITDDGRMVPRRIVAVDKIGHHDYDKM